MTEKEFNEIVEIKIAKFNMVLVHVGGICSASTCYNGERFRFLRNAMNGNVVIQVINVRCDTTYEVTKEQWKNDFIEEVKGE